VFFGEEAAEDPLLLNVFFGEEAAEDPLLLNAFFGEDDLTNPKSSPLFPPGLKKLRCRVGGAAISI
jgi:hypothetical protein